MKTNLCISAADTIIVRVATTPPLMFIKFSQPCASMMDMTSRTN